MSANTVGKRRTEGERLSNEGHCWPEVPLPCRLRGVVTGSSRIG
jgi:hypothetical protein